ncbi:MAG: GntR family transcriptional regulator [Kiritimatiellales bacterium]|nr:GntR family transcriptional regulator [Kiritimatiellales bacterium]
MKYIVSEHLGAGAALPSHEVLRERLRVGNDTLSQAMQLLAADGVVKTARRIRTVVADPARASIRLWTVALALPPEISAFTSLLHSCLRQSLNQHNCADLTFMRPPERRWVIQDSHPAADYIGLDQAAASGEIDAIVAMDRVICRHVPVCRITHHDNDFGVLLDNDAMIADALGVLRRRGSNRPLIIATGEKPRGREIPQLPFVMEEDGPEGRWLRIYKRPEARQGILLADWLLNLPSAERPDGIVCTDDHVTLGLTAALLRHPAFRVPITTCSNRQIPLPFLLPVIRYEIDVVEVASLTVRLLVDTLLAGSPATGCIRYPFTRIEPDDMLV